MDRRAFLTSMLIAPAVVAAGEDAEAAATWTQMTEVGFSFFRSSSYVRTSEVVLPATPRVVFDVLADPEPWPRWLSLVEKVEYRAPYGLHTERDVTTTGGTVIRERFFCWDPGERFAFSVKASTSGLLRSFAEDYLLKPVQGGATRLVWTVAADPQPWAIGAGTALMATFAAATPSSFDKLKLVVKERRARGT